MEQCLVYLYLASQIFVFTLYIPQIKTVLKSKAADAINVPAQFAFFFIGGIAALYMLLVNHDKLAFAIICIHIVLGNLTTALIALKKQRKE